MTSIQRVGGAALLGAACGMRTFTGPAALALRGRLEGAPVRAALIAAAAGEAIADKTPLFHLAPLHLRWLRACSAAP
jgi:hypothetical protein